MKKISEKWLEEKSGITAKVYFEEVQHFEEPIKIKKKIRIRGRDNKVEFVFNKSSSETLKEVGNALIEIAEFVEKL